MEVGPWGCSLGLRGCSLKLGVEVEVEGGGGG